MKRKRYWLLLSLPVLLLAAVPAVYFGWLGWMYTHPEKKPLLHTPVYFELPYQDVSFPSTDEEITLRGWHIPADEQDRVVIFAHGYNENRESATVALYMADALYEEGISSILFDFRGSGESDDGTTSLGYYEKDDLLGAIEYAKELGYRRIGLVGFSMGASTALDVAPQVPEVRAVVADSPYTDLDTYLQEHLPNLHAMPDLFFLPKFILWEMKMLTGIDAEDVRPIQAISQMHSKAVFLIHAEGDEVIPASESRLLQHASNAPNTVLWVSPSRDHVGTFHADPNDYLKRTMVFLKYHLTKDEQSPPDVI